MAYALRSWAVYLLHGICCGHIHSQPTEWCESCGGTQISLVAAAIAEGFTDPTVFTPALLPPPSLPVPPGKASDKLLSKVSFSLLLLQRYSRQY